MTQEVVEEEVKMQSNKKPDKAQPVSSAPPKAANEKKKLKRADLMFKEQKD